MPGNLNERAAALLALKAKAAHGIPWSSSERMLIDNCFQEESEWMPVLAACCVLASKRPKSCSKSFGILMEAIGRINCPAYVEIFIYEALTCTDVIQLWPFRTELVRYISDSIDSRNVDLTNAIFLLGMLARAGDSRALALLRSLVLDSEASVRSAASLIMKGLNE